MKHVKSICEFFNDKFFKQLRFDKLSSAMTKKYLEGQKQAQEVQEKLDDKSRARCGFDDATVLLRVDARPSRAAWEEWGPKFAELEEGYVHRPYDEAWPEEKKVESKEHVADEFVKHVTSDEEFAELMKNANEALTHMGKHKSVELQHEGPRSFAVYKDDKKS